MSKLDAYKRSGFLYNYGCLHVVERDRVDEGMEIISDSFFKF
jgi:hypothetical protein